MTNNSRDANAVIQSLYFRRIAKNAKFVKSMVYLQVDLVTRNTEAS